MKINMRFSCLVVSFFYLTVLGSAMSNNTTRNSSFTEVSDGELSNLESGLRDFRVSEHTGLRNEIELTPIDLPVPVSEVSSSSQGGTLPDIFPQRSQRSRNALSQDIVPQRSLRSQSDLSRYRRQDTPTPNRAQDIVPQRSLRSQSDLSRYRRQDTPTPDRAQDIVPHRSLRSQSDLPVPVSEVSSSSQGGTLPDIFPQRSQRSRNALSQDIVPQRSLRSQSDLSRYRRQDTPTPNRAQDIVPQRSLRSQSDLSRYRRQDTPTPDRAQDIVPQISLRSRSHLSRYRRHDTAERVQDIVPQRSLRSRNALPQYRRQDPAQVIPPLYSDTCGMVSSATTVFAIFCMLGQAYYLLRLAPASPVPATVPAAAAAHTPAATSPTRAATSPTPAATVPAPAATVPALGATAPTPHEYVRTGFATDVSEIIACVSAVFGMLTTMGQALFILKHSLAGDKQAINDALAKFLDISFWYGVAGLTYICGRMVLRMITPRFPFYRFIPFVVDEFITIPAGLASLTVLLEMLNHDFAVGSRIAFGVLLLIRYALAAGDFFWWSRA